MPEVDIEWPWQYNFPPFFTLQPHPETRAKQVTAWKSLILNYCEKTKTYTIDVRETNQNPLFNNTTINRKLEQDVIISILSELQKSGNAAPVDKSKNRWEIYWHTLEEWASIIYDSICDRGMQNTVVTFYELTQGDDVTDLIFFGMNQDVLIKALRVLENERKCELILEDDIQGAKFF
ncbi:vacuolar protein-sorting-associated protein 25 [Diorhabda sublineata]|uniref:vacuolar protein-sorting-associated protein 25 n=1 Tax=Diorhabda sublineata TaxID=1163346 RepID=UPI0024E18A25|nr:vacuolar protein-sorting-associated protein 25 [Diorhabda sublineata]